MYDKESFHNICNACAEGDLGKLVENLSDFTPRKSGKAKLNFLFDEEGKTPLHYAVESENLDCLSLLLENSDIDIKLHDVETDTVLHYACQENMDIDLIKTLVKHDRMCINTQGFLSRTPLEIALESSNEFIVNYLLSVKGLNIDVPNAMSSLGFRNSDYESKVMCFLNLHNKIKGPDAPYELEHIFRLCSLSCVASETSMVPYFLENLYSKAHNSKYPLIEKIRDKFGSEYDVVVLLLHDDMKVETLVSAGSRVFRDFLSKLNDMLKVTLYDTEDEIGFRLFLEFIVETKQLIDEITMLCLIESIVDEDDEYAFDEAVAKRFRILLKVLSTNSNYSVNSLLEHVIKTIENDAIRGGYEFYSEKHKNLLDVIMPFTIPELFPKISHIIVPSFSFQKYLSFQELQKVDLDDDIMDFISLKRLCRDAIRGRVYRNTFSSWQGTKKDFKKKEIDFHKRIELLKCEIPGELVDFIKFLE